MYRKFLELSGKTMFFAKWTGRSDAIFLSLGKCIKISVLAVSYFVLNTFNTMAQTDTVKIQDITVSAYKTKTSPANTARIVHIVLANELRELPLTSIADALKSAMNVDLRERGVFGIQSDLNIRGGSFEQNVVLINGVKMTDPQTGHFQMNLPIELSNIEHIELLRGSSSGLYGNNAFSGAVNFITGNDNKSGINASLTVGEHSLFAVNLSADLNSKKVKNYISVSKKKSDGYTHNTDFDILNLFYKGKYIGKAGYLQVQAGFLNKSFGAYNFYTPKFPDQYEQNKTLLANIKFFSSKSLKINPSVYWRRNYDRFELFRYEKPTWYKNHNYHKTDVVGADITGQIPTQIGEFGFKLDWNAEMILSNVLGEKLDNPVAIKETENLQYTKGKVRQNFNIAAEKQIKLDRTIIYTQLLCNYNSMFDWNLYPGIDINYSINDNVKLTAAANMAGRVPSFTELYYKGGGLQGNADLKPEKANSFEIGSKYFNNLMFVQTSVYFRQGNNIIDWTKENADDNWKSTNLSKINTIGYDFIAKINVQKLMSGKFPIKQISLSYGYIDMDLEKGQKYSRYVLDYLRHNAGLSIHHSIFKKLNVAWLTNFQYRNGNYLPYTELNGKWAYREAKNYEPTFLFDVKLSYKIKKFAIHLQVKNIFDTKNQNIENVFLPGRWISGGLSYKVNFEKNKNNEKNF